MRCMSVSRHGGLTQDRPRGARDTFPIGGGPRKVREKGRKRNTHAGGTTHDGPVICWTPHGHVVPHGHEVHSIVHFLALSRGVSYRQRAVQLYGRSRLRATRIDVKREREGGSGGRWAGRERKGAKKEAELRHLSARDECDGKRIII